MSLRCFQKWRVVKFILIRRIEDTRRGKWLEALELGRRCEISFRWLNYFADRFLVNVTVSRGKYNERKKEKK